MPRNRILSALSPETHQQLERHLEPVWLERRRILHDYDVPIEHAYFPENSVGSIVEVMSDGSAVETATVGFEGMVGIALFYGNTRMAAQAFCQVSGEALRVDAGIISSLLARDSHFRAVMGRYAQALFQQVAQSSACNRMHNMTQRCARWLLQTSDRVGAAEFELSQQFLAQMLGVRRATVSEAAGKLQRAGCIEYRYGIIHVTDRPALESASCECYRVTTRELARLLEGIDSPNPLGNVRMSEDGMSLTTAPLRPEAEALGQAVAAASSGRRDRRGRAGSTSRG
jgi:CRP-like cAMP-binding protein